MKEAELGLFHLKIFILLCDNFPNKKKELNLRMIKLWKRNHRALFLFQFYSRTAILISFLNKECYHALRNTNSVCENEYI